MMPVVTVVTVVAVMEVPVMSVMPMTVVGCLDEAGFGGLSVG